MKVVRTNRKRKPRTDRTSILGRTIGGMRFIGFFRDPDKVKATYAYYLIQCHCGKLLKFTTWAIYNTRFGPIQHPCVTCKHTLTEAEIQSFQEFRESLRQIVAEPGDLVAHRRWVCTNVSLFDYRLFRYVDGPEHFLWKHKYRATQFLPVGLWVSEPKKLWQLEPGTLFPDPPKAAYYNPGCKGHDYAAVPTYS